MNIAVVTTFPSNMFDVYAKDMLTSFVSNWPSDIPLLVQLDDPLVEDMVRKIIRPIDGICVGWTQDHIDFVHRNKDRDDKQDYRKQGVRFCHKVFALHRAWQGAKAAIEAKDNPPRYLIWMDADTVTTRKVTLEDIKLALPKEGDAVSYLGRKDWPHSECGWLAFDLDNEGGTWIDVWHSLYVTDQVWKLREFHDSWVFDHIRNSKDAPPSTNLTEGKPGMDIWPQSPMASWSAHKKGPIAKGLVQQELYPQKGKVVVQTRNAIPHEQIREHIEENQKLITNWVRPCKENNEQIVVVSAGPSLIPEIDVIDDYNKGKKIVAVKHALEPLKRAGIKPWACILLDPRPHVLDFVEEPDKDVLWFVASQVNPQVTQKLLAKGCTVWGYHASVGADEGELTSKQPYSVIGGGSATATRGLFLLKHLGFYRMKLVGYDLCFPDKVDMNALDEMGQPKYMELSVGWNDPFSPPKKCFWTKPEFIAQFEEFNDIIQSNIFELDYAGDGIIPFILRSKKGGELRRRKLTAKIEKPVYYKKLLKWNNKRKTNFLTTLRRLLSKTLQTT